MTRRDWREVVAEAHATLENPKVPEATKVVIRAKLAELEAQRVSALAALDQASASWEEFCGQYGL